MLFSVCNIKRGSKVCNKMDKIVVIILQNKRESRQAK